MKRKITNLLMSFALLAGTTLQQVVAEDNQDNNDTGAKQAGITVIKEWKDDEDHSKDKVTVELLKFGQPVGDPVTLSKDNDWKHTFTDLEWTTNGGENVYFVRETELNDDPMDELVKSGKYKEPEIKVTKPAEEVVVSFNKERWVIEYSAEASHGEFVFLFADGTRSTDGNAEMFTINTDAGMDRLTWVQVDTFKDDKGEHYSYYVDNVQDRNVLVKENVTDTDNGKNYYRFSRDGRYLSLAKLTDGSYEYVFTDKVGLDNETGITYFRDFEIYHYNYHDFLKITVGSDEVFLFNDDKGFKATDRSTIENNGRYYGFYTLSKVTASGEEKGIKETITIFNEKIKAVDEETNNTGKLTVVSTWENYDADSITIRLLANGKPVDGKEVVLSKESDTYTFENLPVLDSNGNTVVYYIEETQINGVDVKEQIASGKYAAPEIKVTKSAQDNGGDSTVGKTYWIPETNRDDQGTFVLEDKTNYLIVTNDWMNNNLPIALFAVPEYNFLDTKPIDIVWGKLPSGKARGTENVDHYIVNPSNGMKWYTTVDDDGYRFSNAGKNITLLGAYPNIYRFILTSKVILENTNGAIYQPKMKLFNKDGYTGIMSNITIVQPPYINVNQDMFLYMKDGKFPTEFCKNDFAAGFEFYKEVTQYIQTESPQEISILNRKIPENTVEKDLTVIKKWDDKMDHSNDSVTIQLLKDGEPTGETVKLDASNGWKYTFYELKVEDEDGHKIVYTVEETEINGKPVDELVKAGKYAKPVVEVTKASEDDFKEVEVEVENEYWVPVEDKKDDGTYLLEDGETYVIATNNWEEGDKPIGVEAEPATNTITTSDLTVVNEAIEIDGKTYDRQLRDVKDTQKWTVTVEDGKENLYRFANAGKNLTLTEKLQNIFRFILSDKEGWFEVESTQYQPVLQLQNKDGNTIIAGRSERTNPPTYMYMFMKDGYKPTEFCKNDFAAAFNFYKNVKVKEKETERVLIATPEEITITNKELPTPKKPPVPNTADMSDLQ